MDHVVDLVSQASNLVYDINKLMKSVNKDMDSSFLDGAEEGKSIDKYNLEDEKHIELFNKRKDFFSIFNQIVDFINHMSYEEKRNLTNRIEALIAEHLMMYVRSFDKYQDLINEITEPDFSFEGHLEYKQQLIELKEDFSKHQAAAEYLKNLIAYLGSYRRSK